MGFKVLGRTEEIMRGYAPRKGLEGPFVYSNGRILYYDSKAGQYWDPRTDFYVEQEEINALHEDMVRALSR